MADLYRGTAYGIGLSQAAVALGVVTFGDPVLVHVYTTRMDVRPLNQTIFLADLRDSGVNVGSWVLITSFLVALFSTTTYHVAKLGFGSNDYQPVVLEEIKFWDFIFWIVVMLLHGIVVMLLCNPVSFYGAALASLLMVYFLGRSCAPRCGQLTMTSENLNFVGLGVGFLLICCQLGGSSSNLYLVLCGVLVADYMLGIGHVWDSSPTMDTVINCRLSYACMGILGLVGLYSTWGPAMYDDRLRK